uniref:AAA+ ATPase domain-containing protein n=1 Tax=viral metagenome TaxID=1070528 RepID=A0A6C0IVW1_9ZZZZ
MTEFTPFDSLKYSFINNFKTGNILVDSLITTMILGVLSYIYSLRHYLTDYYYILYDYLTNRNVNQISFCCTETSVMYGHRSGAIKMQGSDAFKAIMLELKENIQKGNAKNLKKLKEFCADKEEHLWDDYDDESDKERKIDDSIRDIMYLVDQKKKFSIKSKYTEELEFRMVSKIKENKEEKQKTNIGSCTTYKLIISTKKKNLMYIQNYINLCLKKYQDKLNDKINNNQFVFMYEGFDNNELNYTTYPFHTTCNIDNIYFDNKTTIMKQIDFYKNNKDWYIKNGKPYTLGICSYGEPGCGKTSFEKALAKYLNRHIIIVDLSKIKTQQEADRIFFSEVINSKRIPYNKRIYIFPDIDAMNSIISREEPKQKPSQINLDTLEKKLLLDKFKKDKNIDEDFVTLLSKSQPKNKNSNEPLNLSKLLNIIDGIPERTGQIIIFNTNHPNRLDPALIRPGRVDCLIHFQKMSPENTFKLIENYFDNTHLKKKFIESKLKNIGRFWTPAEIFQICSKYNNIQKVLEILEKKQKIKFV